MAGTDSSTAITPGSGDYVDEDVLTVGATSVKRQRMRVAGAAAAELSDVRNSTPGSTDYGQVVRPIPSGIQTITGQQAARQTANIGALNAVVGPYTATNYNIATVTVSGTYVGVSFVFEASDDGSTWFVQQGSRSDTGILENGATLLTSTTRAWDVSIGGYASFRVRDTAWTSGTAVIGVNLQSMPYETAPTIAGMPKGTLGAPSAISVTTSATLLLAANPGRKVGFMTNNSTSVTMYIGTSGVTAANGQPVPPGGQWVDSDANSAWYGITAAGTVDARVEEVT